jgi:regulator of ribonuclease activity A
MSITPPMEFKATCDLVDEFGDNAKVPEVQWTSYGDKSQFCGHAVTVQCTEDNSWLKEILELSIGEGKVLVVDGGGSKKCALLGDRLAEAALTNKYAGIILYGCVRDVDALSKLDIGIQAIGHTPRKSTPSGKGAADVVVQIGNVSVSPGDLVYADNDGVVFLSPQDAAP